MAKTINITLDAHSIDAAIAEIDRLRTDVCAKSKLLIERLAEIGYDTIYSVLDNHVWSGETLANLKCEYMGQDGQGNVYKLSTASEAILILEFGSGIKHSGTVNPKSAELGVGLGSYPGNGHWDDPNGWWFPTEDSLLVDHYDENGQGWAHSYGMEAQMPFYKAAREIERQVHAIAMEVFGA